jgi:hypothetical protein
MVNVDIVYKTVLYILNKEQRGYITPDEFNKLGIQVQREIFEQYFEELNQQLRIPQTDNEYANRIKNLEEKIDIFKTFNSAVYDSATTPNTPYFTLPTDLHRLGTLIYNEKEIQGVNRNQYFLINKSPLIKPTSSNPLYILQGTGSPSAAPSHVYVYPSSIISGIDVYYVKTPANPSWGYTLGNVGQYVYNGTENQFALIATRDMGVGTPAFPSGAITQNTTAATTPSAPGNIGGTAGYTTSGLGDNAEITITATGGVVTSVVVGSLIGQGFQVGDTITVSSTVLGGVIDLILTLRQSDLLYDSAAYSTDFELHSSEQTNIILNILMYSGVIIRDPQIVQTAARMVQQDEALEKQ